MSNFLNEYLSPLGIIKLESDGEYLTGLWFDKSKDNNKHMVNNEYKNLSYSQYKFIIEEDCTW